MKWYRDRDGNLLPRPASDDPYLDAWLEDYFTSWSGRWPGVREADH